MTKYVELKTAIDAVNDVYYDTPDINLSADKLEAALRGVPSVDVAPVVHSYWEHKIMSYGENVSICHNCKYPVSWFWELANYCPNCGAMMDGGEE